MPLLRDQKNETSIRPAAPTATTNHLHLPLRQPQSDEVPKTLSIREMDRSSKRITVKTHTSGTGGKHQLNVGDFAGFQSAPNPFKPEKMTAPNTMKMHQAANAQHVTPADLHASRNRREEPRSTSASMKNRMPIPQNMSAFDDTESLDGSMLNNVVDDEKTAVLISQGTNPYVKQDDVYTDSYEDDREMVGHGIQIDAMTQLHPGWQGEVDDQRQFLAEKLVHTPQPKRPHERGMHIGSRSQHPQAPTFDDRQEPDTPTRTQSAPPVGDAQPNKSVRIATSHQIMNPSSPSIVSSEMAREDSLQQPTARPNGVQPQARNTLVHARPQRLPPLLQGQMRQNVVLPAHAARFQPISHHVQGGRQDNPKVSAPESDNQDFSGDERARSPQHFGNQEEHSITVQQGNLATRKRSHDDMNYELDYPLTDLKRKTLSDLQAEPFPQDPRAILQAPPTENMGNEMSLNQILENLSKVSGDTQREIFRTLTDEQWASTGQWFVDRFQTQLEELMEVRLERRKIAMKYEDMIRRRQRVVEQYQTQVGNELDELQTGGRLLVDGRKVPTGSRSGTPMKGDR